MAQTNITADHRGSHSTIKSVWSATDLPLEALNHLQLTGASPALPSSFQVGVAAQSSIALAALAAAQIGYARTGDVLTIAVDMNQAEIECTGYFKIDGKVPASWAPLSGLYPCEDGHVRIHANFDHHRDGALKILGLHRAPESYSKDDLARALMQWSAIDYETAAAKAGMVVSAVRSFEQWDSHPQAKVIDKLPLITIEKIGEAAPRQLPKTSPGMKVLDGLKVLDLTRILAGPVCGRTLAAYGAEVMLVNSPTLPNIDHIADTSRGKLSTHLDLRNPVDNGHLRKLISDAHVFVQGYRPGGLTGLGYAPEQIARLRPGICTVSLSAYGHDGPWADRRGFDSLVQTATGFNHAEAQAAGAKAPKALPVQILDYASGFLMAFAAEAAILKQQNEGGSWHASISLAQTAHWIRGLGRVDANFNQSNLDFSTALQQYPSNFGVLEAIPHAARFSAMKSDWHRPSSRPGSHPPIWPV